MATPSVYSLTSFSSSSSQIFWSSLSMESKRPNSSASSTPPIASLPSFAHSLSSLPTMTSVGKDMVHYGTLGRTKRASEAKLKTALLKTKERQAARSNPEVNPPIPPTTVYLPRNDDDEPLMMMKRKQKRTDRSS